MEFIDMQKRQVRKRDGKTLQAFDVQKIENAIKAAWDDVTSQGISLLKAEKLGNTTEERVRKVASTTVGLLPAEDVIDIEVVQDAVELALMRHEVFPIAKAYIVYREKRAEARRARRQPDPKAVSDYIHAGKYARYQPEKKRREVYLETVARDEAMHLKRFPQLAEKIRWAFDFIREQRLLPSMRSMQFGGIAIEVNNNRMYNCSSTHIDRMEAFSEAFFLLLCGCGVGYSIQFQHIDKLPELKKIDESKVVHHVVSDSVEGWADALKALLYAYVDGVYIEFSYEKIIAGHPQGAPLKTSGGKAPGHLPLKRALERVRAILHEAQGRHLRSVECHRILCHAADAVLSGGIRRSAMIALFSLADSEMMNIKTGDWYAREPWLENANNSVVLKRDDVKEEHFKRCFQMTRQWGEPGFVFVADYDETRNPCVEIGMNCRLKIDYEVMKLLKERAKRGKAMPNVKLGEVYTGFSFCNLVEMNAAKLKSLEDFLQVAEAATFVGTLQAAYTHFPYLGWVSEVIAEREALLGVGMTGIMDSPEVALNPDYQRQVAEKCVEWNGEFAEMVGIRSAARVTTVKPSGTTSLELGCVGSGHHAHHARRYIRRVVANEMEPVFQHFYATNPHMCVRKPDGDWVIEFPVQAPDGAIIKEELTAIQFLELVKRTQLNWVVPGTARPQSSPGYVHNVSNTVHVRPEEWPQVADYLWQNREYFSGVSFLELSGDKKYTFAPYEAVTTEADEARWNRILANYKPVDYTALMEEEDTTDLTAEPACASGSCEAPR